MFLLVSCPKTLHLVSVTPKLEKLFVKPPFCVSVVKNAPWTFSLRTVIQRVKNNFMGQFATF